MTLLTKTPAYTRERSMRADGGRTGEFERARPFGAHAEAGT